MTTTMTVAIGPGEVFPTLLKLFTHRHSFDLRERQVLTLKRLCKVYREGFFVADLKSLAELLTIVGQLVAENAEPFVEPLLEILGICSIPFVKEIASEEYRNFNALCDTIEALGRLLVCTDKRVQLAASEVLATYAGTEGGQPATVSYHHQVLANSRIAENISAGLSAITADDKNVLLLMLRVVLELSRTAELSMQLLEAGCLPAVVESLKSGFKTELVSVAIEALWNVFELAPEAAGELSTLRTVEVMRDLLLELVNEGHRIQDKEIRNELLLLCTYIAQQDKHRDVFATSSMLDILMTTASAIEAENPHVKPFVLTGGGEDFEMKRAMIHITCLLSNNEACMERIAEHPTFIPALVLHLDERLNNHAARRKYSRQHSRQLQVQCLSSLSILVPKCSERFLELDGIQIVLDFMTEQSEESLRSGCLQLLVNTADLEGYQQQLGGRAVAMMLSLVKEKAMHPFHIRQDALSVLSRLCQGSSENQAVVGELEGVQVLIDSLEWTVEETTRTEPMTLTAVDAVWSVVAGNEDNELAFEQAGGMAALVRLLEECPQSMKLLLVSCLTQLLENEMLMESLQRWRSKTTRKGVVPLLLDLWADEEQRKNEAAKMFMEVHNEEYTREEEMKSNDLVVHLTGQNMSTKLYSLLFKLGFQTADQLTAEQEKRLMQIEKYMELKDAILWRTLAKELSDEGVRPTTPDNRRLDNRLKSDSNMEDNLNDDLLEVDDRQDDEEMKDLKAFYQRVHNEEAAKRSTAKRITQSVPTSTRTKIIVDSHKAQVYPPLINPSTQSDQTPTKNNNTSIQSTPGATKDLPPSTGKKSRPSSATVDDYLGDAATSRMVASRPSSGRPNSGKGNPLPAGSGVHAAAALRAS